MPAQAVNRQAEPRVFGDGLIQGRKVLQEGLSAQGFERHNSSVFCLKLQVSGEKSSTSIPCLLWGIQECLECSYSLPAPVSPHKSRLWWVPGTRGSGVSRAESPGHLYLEESVDPSPAVRVRKKNQGVHRGCTSKGFGNKECKYCGEATTPPSLFLSILY